MRSEPAPGSSTGGLGFSRTQLSSLKVHLFLLPRPGKDRMAPPGACPLSALLQDKGRKGILTLSLIEEI